MPTITVIAPIGSGASNPSAGAYALAPYDDFQIVAVPTSGWRFDHFDVVNASNPAGESTANPLIYPAIEDTVITPVFVNAPPGTVTVSASCSAGGTINPSGNISNVPSGGIIVFIATPYSGYRLKMWSTTGGVVPNVNGNVCEITANGNGTVYAEFESYSTVIPWNPWFFVVGIVGVLAVVTVIAVRRK